MKMDALSEALRSIRITGALLFNAELTAPWGASTPRVDAISHLLAPGTEHLVLFHLILEGSAVARVSDGAEVLLAAGDLAVLPHGDAHDLWSGRHAVLRDATELLPRILSGSIELERGGGGGDPTRFVCGYFGCDRDAARLLLAGLPPLLKVDVRGGRTGAWLEHAIRHTAAEVKSDQIGRRAVLSKLCEALFVEALCGYLATVPAEGTGWLAAVRDEATGHALALVHRDPGRAWTLVDLAAGSGVSRTVLTERFDRLLGESPLAYLGRWRLQVAARMLRTTNRVVLDIALEVGYASESAFNRAFKRRYGLPPGRYRQSQRSVG